MLTLTVFSVINLPDNSNNQANLLSQQDSNLYKQNQNLLCYHYTMGQFSNRAQSYTKNDTHKRKMILNPKIIVHLQVYFSQ